MVESPGLARALFLGYFLGFYRDDGRYNGNCYNRVCIGVS